MSGFRILVVDDEPLALEMVATILRRAPDVESVIECRDARIAPDLLTQHQPHVVFLDIEMPAMDGL